jgi:allantoin racemase
MSKPRLLLIHAFSLAEGAAYHVRPFSGEKEKVLMNYDKVAHLLDTVEWDLHPGAPSTHGNWPVETREEFMSVGFNRLKIVREACKSGKYDAIVLLGGGDPGFDEAREIGVKHGVAVTACAHAQMVAALSLGSKFSIIDISEAHNMQMAALVARYRMASRCVSIRNIDYPLPRPPYTHPHTVSGEKDKWDKGEVSGMLEEALAHAVEAIEEDGAEVLIIGCSGAYWLCEPLRDRLAEMGWKIPVLEGYRCAIQAARNMAELKVTASALAFPSDNPIKIRRRKLVTTD